MATFKTAKTNGKDEETQPAQKSGSPKKNEKRLFQRGSDPADKVELTKDEAESEGFYWKD